VGALGRPDQCRYRRGAGPRPSHELARARDGGPDWLAYFTAAALHAELGQALRDPGEPGSGGRVRGGGGVRGRRTDLYEREGPSQLRGHVIALTGVADARILLADAAGTSEALRAACTLAVRLRSRHTEETAARRCSPGPVSAFPQEPGLRELTDRLRDRPRERFPGPGGRTARASVPHGRNQFEQIRHVGETSRAVSGNGSRRRFCATTTACQQHPP